MARTSQPWGSLLLGATNVFQTSTLDLNHWYARSWLPNSRNNSNREMGFLIQPLRDLGTQPIGHVAGYSKRVNDCRMTTVSRFCRAKQAPDLQAVTQDWIGATSALKRCTLTLKLYRLCSAHMACHPATVSASHYAETPAVS
jgi:hypothetical protein